MPKKNLKTNLTELIALADVVSKHCLV